MLLLEGDIHGGPQMSYGLMSAIILAASLTNLIQGGDNMSGREKSQLVITPSWVLSVMRLCIHSQSYTPFRNISSSIHPFPIQDSHISYVSFSNCRKQISSMKFLQDSYILLLERETRVESWKLLYVELRITYSYSFKVDECLVAVLVAQKDRVSQQRYSVPCVAVPCQVKISSFVIRKPFKPIKQEHESIFNSLYVSNLLIVR